MIAISFFKQFLLTVFINSLEQMSHYISLNNVDTIKIVFKMITLQINLVLLLLLSLKNRLHSKILKKDTLQTNDMNKQTVFREDFYSAKNHCQMETTRTFVL